MHEMTPLWPFISAYTQLDQFGDDYQLDLKLYFLFYLKTFLCVRCNLLSCSTWFYYVHQTVHEKWMSETMERKFLFVPQGDSSPVFWKLWKLNLYTKNVELFLLSLISSHCWWSNITGKRCLYFQKCEKHWKLIQLTWKWVYSSCEEWVTYNYSLGDKAIVFALFSSLKSSISFKGKMTHLTGKWLQSAKDTDMKFWVTHFLYSTCKSYNAFFVTQKQNSDIHWLIN